MQKVGGHLLSEFPDMRTREICSGEEEEAGSEPVSGDIQTCECRHRRGVDDYGDIKHIILM